MYPLKADRIEVTVHRITSQVAQMNLLETLGREGRVIVARHAAVVVPHDAIRALQPVRWFAHSLLRPIKRGSARRGGHFPSFTLENRDST